MKDNAALNGPARRCGPLDCGEVNRACFYSTGPSTASGGPGSGPCLHVPPTGRGRDPPPRDREVQELIDEAEKAAKRLETARARELWARINTLKPSTMAACQLGVFDLGLDRLEEAAAELEKCVEQMPAPTNDLERRRLRGEACRAGGRSTARGRAPHQPPAGHGAAPRGRSRGKRGRPRLRHARTARGHGDGQAGAGSPCAREGGGARLAARLARLRDPEGCRRTGPCTGSGRPAPARSSAEPLIIGAGAAASAALLGAGVGLHAAGDAAESEATANVARLSEGTVFLTSARFRQLHDDANAANTRAGLFRGFGTAALVAGATLGAATVVYVVWPRKAEIRPRGAGAEVKLGW